MTLNTGGVGRTTIDDGEFEQWKRRFETLERKVEILERKVVRKDHLLRIISDIAEDELDANGDEPVNDGEGAGPV